MLSFALICIGLHANTNNSESTSENKMTVVVALPFQEGKPFDTVHWYGPDYIDYIRSLLPKEKYTVTGYFVSLQNIPKFLSDMDALYKQDSTLRILNICDGGEWDGYPGISVLTAWEKHPISKYVPLTGSNAEFIYHSDDKIRMNEHLQNAELQILPEAVIPAQDIATTELNAFVKKGKLENSWPLFVKLNIGAGACGIGPQSICHNLDELKAQLNRMHSEYPKSDLLVQPYLPGPEYTIFIVNDKVYMGIRRDFHNSVNLMLDDYMFGVRPIEEEITFLPATKEAGELALKAVLAIPGKHHYTRVDVRGDSKGNLFVIDINDRPGFGNPSTIKSMLDFHHIPETQFLEDIISSAPKQSK